MPDSTALPYVLLGNAQTLMFVSARGAIDWGALPTAGDPLMFDQLQLPFLEPMAGGSFELAPVGEFSVDRPVVGETSVLQTLYDGPQGKLSVLDVLPVRRGATPAQINTRQNRLVRIIECHTGEVTVRMRFAPKVDGVLPSLELDHNGLVCRGETRSVLLQTEADVAMHPHEVVSEFVLRPREKRHFVVTAVDDPDPDVPEMAATEPDWEIDGTFDFWLSWARACPFQGAQRQHVLKLAAWLKSVWLSPERMTPALAEAVFASPYLMLAPLALAAWGWEEELASIMKAWRPEPGLPRDLRQAAWLFAALHTAQASGLVEGTLLVPHWPKLRPLAEALALRAAEAEQPAELLAAWAGVRGAAAIAEELLLEGDTAGWARAEEAAAARLRELGDRLPAAQASALGLLPRALNLKEGTPPAPSDAVEAAWHVRQEYATGAYLQARRGMDQLLQAYGPLGMVEGSQQPYCDLGELALVLWTAAEIYLQGAPEAGRVDLPGDLGD